MTKQRTLLAISLTGIFSLFVVHANVALAAGILGFQPGDRSPENNELWLKKGVEQIQFAIKEAKEGNSEKSMEYGQAGLNAMKEINSEGWAPKLERSFKGIRHGIWAAKKGELEKASLKYQDALERIENLKFGDMIFSHETFMGIGDHK